MDVVDEQVQDVVKYYLTGGDLVTCRQLLALGDGTGGHGSLGDQPGGERASGEGCGGYCVQDLVEVIRLHMPEDRDPMWMVSATLFSPLTCY